MQIARGLFDHMVLQRNARNVSDTPVEGRCAGKGKVFAEVRRGSKLVKGLARVKLGPSAEGTFSGTLAGIPVGGPYAIRLTLENDKGKVLERLAVKDVLVGDVWVAGGQSNMFGCGRRPQALPGVPRVRAFYMDDRWDIAKDPIHNIWDCVDQVHVDISGGAQPIEKEFATIGVGPAVAFGQEMHRLSMSAGRGVRGVPQGLLACAHGGTSMGQWNPALRDQCGKSLYGATLRRVQKNGGKVAGVIWYQGESDANPEAAAMYTDRMKDLVAAFRRDFKDPRLPVAIVQIGRVVGAWDSVHWNSIQDQERRLPQVIPNLAVTPAVDLALDDLIHIAGPDQHRLGRRLAHAMGSLTRDKKRPHSIDFKSFTIQTNKVTGLAEVVVQFTGVIGALRAPARPSGFTVTDQAPVPLIFDTRLERDRVVLSMVVAPDALEGKSLSYGHGVDPYCNITDAADRALPVFGPIPLMTARAITRTIQNLRVSKPLPSAGKLQGLAYPADHQDLDLRLTEFAGNIINLNPQLGPLAPEDRLVYFQVRVRCQEAMRVGAHFGYDGPAKLWVEGQEKFHDPSGTNPIAGHIKRVDYDAPKGDHEIMMALGSNRGQAWGISLRLERLDVPEAQLARGPGHYAMPTVV